MVDLSKTEKLLKSSQKKLESHLVSLEIGTPLRKKILAKAKNYVSLSSSLHTSEDSDDEDDGTPESHTLQQVPPQEAVAAVSFSLPLPFLLSR
jgi:hypothetical protein